MSNLSLGAAGPSENRTALAPGSQRVLVAFVCENAGRPGRIPSSGRRPRPEVPAFAWPLTVREVVVPCAGRLQPEHLLKAFEDGADAIGVVCCREGNCHHLEGNRRCARRLAYVDGLLKQIGLGEGRLQLLPLPGSAQEDMALALAGPTSRAGRSPAGSEVAAVRDAFLAHVATLAPNPMRAGALLDGSP
ncbi:MAG: hydrogenase iron-sulfur subunit [Polyangia bacterium]|jgi:coenzyme F420-reducing hydrogenase delta subunit